MHLSAIQNQIAQLCTDVSGKESDMHTPLLISCVFVQDPMALNGKLCVVGMIYCLQIARIWTLEDLTFQRNFENNFDFN